MSVVKEKKKGKSIERSQRKKRPKEFCQRLIIAEINDVAKLEGINYTQLISGLKMYGVKINRNMLFKMAVSDKEHFSLLCEYVKSITENKKDAELVLEFSSKDCSIIEEICNKCTLNVEKHKDDSLITIIMKHYPPGINDGNPDEPGLDNGDCGKQDKSKINPIIRDVGDEDEGEPEGDGDDHKSQETEKKY